MEEEQHKQRSRDLDFRMMAAAWSALAPCHCNLQLLKVNRCEGPAIPTKRPGRSSVVAEYLLPHGPRMR